MLRSSTSIELTEAGQRGDVGHNSLSAWVTMETGVCEAIAYAKEPWSPPRPCLGTDRTCGGKYSLTPGFFLQSKGCLCPIPELAQQEKQGFLTVLFKVFILI